MIGHVWICDDYPFFFYKDFYKAARRPLRQTAPFEI